MGVFGCSRVVCELDCCVEEARGDGVCVTGQSEVVDRELSRRPGSSESRREDCFGKTAGGSLQQEVVDRFRKV